MERRALTQVSPSALADLRLMITTCGFFASIHARKRSFLLARVPIHQRSKGCALTKNNFRQRRWKYSKDHQTVLRDERTLFREEPRDRAITPSK
jgi:hypothetical protein